MKMKLLAAASVLAMTATAAVAAPSFYINVGSNSYQSANNTQDADSNTGTFTEFGFNQLLATSVYDLSDNSVNGAFYDTNLASDFAKLGIARSDTAMDGVTTVNLTYPTVGQVNIDSLAPLVPPSFGSDAEGYNESWHLEVRYRFNGVMSASGPSYTGGTWELFFNDFTNNANDRVVVSGHLVGSELQVANLNLFLEVDSAEAGFLFIDDGFGNFSAVGDGTKFNLDTNVFPPIPTASQLLEFVDGDGNHVAVRQTKLDGTISGVIPEPASLALVGLGFAGLFAARRRKA